MLPLTAMERLPPKLRQYLVARRQGSIDPNSEAVLGELARRGELDPRFLGVSGPEPTVLDKVLSGLPPGSNTPEGKGLARNMAATGIGMAGPAVGAALGSALGPAGGALGGIAGSYGAHQLNVGLGLEEGGPLGDLISVAVPGAGYGTSAVARSLLRSGGGGLGAAFGRGALVGGAAQYLTGDPKIAGIAAGVALYGPSLVKQVAKSAAGKALISALSKVNKLMRPEGIAAMLGFLRTQGELATEGEKSTEGASRR